MFKNNKHEFYFMLIVVAAVSFFLGSFFTGNTGFVTSTQSTITSEGPMPGYFEIPSGKVAKDFTASFSKHTKGWGIYRASTINGVPEPKSYDPVYHTTFGNPAEVALPPGEYVAMVDGWEGADVTVYYKVE